MVQINWGVAAAVIGGMANLVWMLVTLRIENRVSAKIDGLKEWMEGRYVSVGHCTGCHMALAVQHVEIERRLVKLESQPAH